MALSSSPSSSLFCAAVITAAHGVRGQVKVKCFLEDPRNFKTYSPYFDENGEKIYRVQNARVSQNETLVVGLEGITTRNDAESLKGAQLLMDRSALPALKEDTFYHQDLLGLTVKSQAGDVLGVIHALYNFGAGELLEVKTAEGSLEMIPFTKEMVPSVDLKAGKVVISSEAADLLKGGESDA